MLDIPPHVPARVEMHARRSTASELASVHRTIRCSVSKGVSVILDEVQSVWKTVTIVFSRSQFELVHWCEEKCDAASIRDRLIQNRGWTRCRKTGISDTMSTPGPRNGKFQGGT